MNKKVLIVEDQFVQANDLQLMLERAGYEVCGIARSVHVAQEMIKKVRPDLVLLDIFLKGNLTGIDLAKELDKEGIAFIFLSANSNEEVLNAAKATRPYGFLVKPYREKDLLIMLEIARYKHESMEERKATARTTGNSHNIVGKSKLLLNVMEQVSQVAPCDTSVLLLGESGTGKERIADCIHQLSSRKAGPFVKVNCAALPSSLIESELFGHEKGAFTGALDKRIGKFEKADNGTILLDEIGEMSMEMQVKLLRVLQEKQIERIGSNDPTPVNVRVIAATNRNLEKEVADGRFRLDLYYRLNVFPLTLPSLKERKEDIPELAQHFIDVSNQRTGKQVSGISDKALAKMMGYHWPGNIRELENVIERSVLMAKGNMIEDFIIQLNSERVEEGPQVKSIQDNERDHIIEVLKKCNGRVWGPDGAAKLLNVPPSTLKSKMSKLGINKEDY
jgi:two-component system, NtrC family, response regulator HydG